MHPHSLGRLGEELALAEVQRRGWRPIARNARFAGVELDILAEADDGLHLIEVKTRKDDACGHPAEAVTARRRARLRRAALALLAEPPHAGVQIHFDVIAIVAGADGERPQLEVLPDAFEVAP